MFKTITSALDPNKTPEKREIEKIQPFVFRRWLSGSPYTIQAANMMNVYHKIPIENQYNLVKSVFAGGIKYIPYPKTQNDDSKHPENVIDMISEHYKVSTQKALEYADLMNPEQLHSLKEMYDIS